MPDSYNNLRRKRCHSLFHSWALATNHCITAGPPHSRMSQLNHSFPHWQGCVKHLPAALPQTSHIEFKSSPPHHPFQSGPALNRYSNTVAVVHPSLLHLQLPGLCHPLLVLGHSLLPLLLHLPLLSPLSSQLVSLKQVLCIYS